MLFPAKGGKRLGRQKQQMSTLTAFQLTIHRSPGANSIQRAEIVSDSMSLAVSIFFVLWFQVSAVPFTKSLGMFPVSLARPWHLLCSLGRGSLLPGLVTGETLALGTGSGLYSSPMLQASECQRAVRRVRFSGTMPTDG